MKEARKTCHCSRSPKTHSRSKRTSLPKSALSISKSRIFSIDCTWQEILSKSFEHQNILERVAKSPMYDHRSSAQFSLLRHTLWLDVVKYSNHDQMAIANRRHIFAFPLSLTHHCVERLQGGKEMQRKPRNMQNEGYLYRWHETGSVQQPLH